jgi:hypothetical protein
MFDENFDRSYQQSRAALNGGIERGLRQLSYAVSNAFRTLDDIQYSAPWSARRRRTPRDA